MKIYVSGDSFTYGDELKDRTVSSWPNLLAKKLNAEMVDTSMSGSSNERILFHTTRHFAEDFDFYFISWSEPNRYTFVRADESEEEVAFVPTLFHPVFGKESFFWDWGRTLYAEWCNSHYNFKRFLQQIIHCQNLLKDKNYLMIHTFPGQLQIWKASQILKYLNDFQMLKHKSDAEKLAEAEEIQYYYNLIDWSKFYSPNNDIWNLRQLCQDFPIGPGGHFLEEGHNHVANLMYEYVQTKNTNS